MRYRSYTTFWDFLFLLWHSWGCSSHHKPTIPYKRLWLCLMQMLQSQKTLLQGFWSALKSKKKDLMIPWFMSPKLQVIEVLSYTIQRINTFHTKLHKAELEMKASYKISLQLWLFHFSYDFVHRFYFFSHDMTCHVFVMLCHVTVCHSSQKFYAIYVNL